MVEKVLKWLEENNLFVKLEKYKWKVKEVEFLGVVIGPKGVEMQKKKVEGVLNWPVPWNVKEVISMKSWGLRAQPQWLFRKNSIEFLVGFS